MNTEEREVYLRKELANCSESQQQIARQTLQRGDSYRMFDTDAGFQNWVQETKKSFENAATEQEISEVIKLMRV